MKQEKDQMIFGVRAVLEAIEAGRELEKVYLKRASGSSGLFKDLRRRLREARVPFQQVPPEKLNRITRKNHQGVIAYLALISYSSIEQVVPGIYEKGEDPMVVVLDQVTDVRNFGAIARTAECSGAHAIVIPERGGARITSEAVKTSAGALHRVPVCRHEDLTGVVAYLKEAGLSVIAASEKTESSLYDTTLSVPVAFIMGAEDRGVSPSLLELADQRVRIPMHGTIASLNVSVAAGIMLYEAVRQRARSLEG